VHAVSIGGNVTNSTKTRSPSILSHYSHLAFGLHSDRQQLYSAVCSLDAHVVSRLTLVDSVCCLEIAFGQLVFSLMTSLLEGEWGRQRYAIHRSVHLHPVAVVTRNSGESDWPEFIAASYRRAE